MRRPDGLRARRETAAEPEQEFWRPPGGVAPCKRPRTRWIGEPRPGAVEAETPAQARAARGSVAGPLDVPLFVFGDVAPAGAVATDPVVATAVEGVRGAGETLPHLEVIQAAFGSHDVRGVVCRVGGGGAAAAAAIGARAYAVGSRVAFASAPDLRTAAHEAAHVVQQRAGLAPASGVGVRGDRYEAEADEVADAVVGGRSAAVLLDAVVARGGGGRPIAAVQRDDRGASEQLVNAAGYLRHNALEALDEIERHLRRVRWPEPHARLGWRDRATFIDSLIAALRGAIGRLDPPTALEKLVFPARPLSIVDGRRVLVGSQARTVDNPYLGGDVGPTDWLPAVGITIGQELEHVIVASLARLGPRWLAAAERAQGSVEGAWVDVPSSSIVTSHWIDRPVAQAIAAPGAFLVRAGEAVGAAALVELRPVRLEWQGARSPRLWNWVRAIEPADATVEEVAAALYAGRAELADGEQASFCAAGISAVPPLFGLPASWARRFDAARAYAPPRASERPDAETGTDLVVDAAASALADEVALAQAGGGQRGATPSASEVLELLADCALQLETLAETLGAWGLLGPVEVARNWIAGKEVEIATGNGEPVARWASVLTAQKAQLRRIGSAVVDIDRGATSMGVTDRNGPEAAPLREVLHAYAKAVATSPFADTCAELVERARAQQARLPLRIVRDTSRDLDRSLMMLREATTSRDPESREVAGAGAAVQEDARVLASRVMAGGTAAPAELDDLTIAAGEVALRARTHALSIQLGVLEDAAREVSSGTVASFAATFSPAFQDVANATGNLRFEVEWITIRMRPVQVSPAAASAMSPGELADRQRAARREALTEAQARFEALAARHDIAAFLREGAELVEWHAFRSACVRIAALIGFGLLANVAGGIAARLVGGLAARAGASTRLVQLAAGATELVTDAAVSATGQVWVAGGSSSDAFLENLITSAGGRAVLHSFRPGVDRLRALDLQAASLWRRIGRRVLLSEGAAITGDAVMGAAFSYVAHKVVTGEDAPPPATVREWLLQGASIAVGRYLGRRVDERVAALQPLARRLPEARALLANERRLALKAAQLEENPDPEKALSLLAREHDLLDEEVAFVEDLLSDPTRARAAGLDERALAHLEDVVDGSIADLGKPGTAELPLHLSGLDELIPGALWRGSRDQIERAFASARAAGIDVDATRDPTTGRWRAHIGDRWIDLHEHRARVNEPVTGLFDSIRSTEPEGWTLIDGRIHVERDGTRVLRTDVICNGKTGAIVRAYNPQTRTLEMRMAFLDNLPQWVDEGKPLVPGRGTPTVTYLTIRQMKALGAEYGAVHTVKMSGIQNLKAIIQLHARRIAGEDPDAAVLKTHSVAYGETAIVQSGHRIVSARVTGDIWKHRTLGWLMLGYENLHSDPSSRDATIARHDELIREYGAGVVNRDTLTWMNYDVVLEAAPFDSTEATTFTKEH